MNWTEFIKSLSEDWGFPKVGIPQIPKTLSTSCTTSVLSQKAHTNFVQATNSHHQEVLRVRCLNTR